MLWTIGSTVTYLYDAYYEIYKEGYKVVHEYQQKRIEKFNKKIIAFNENPTITAGMELADWHHSIGEYQKALSYCEKCVELGAEDIPRLGALIRFWMSDIYLEFNNRERAIENFKLALKLDNGLNTIKYEWISDPELKDIFIRIKNTNKTKT